MPDELALRDDDFELLMKALDALGEVAVIRHTLSTMIYGLMLSGEKREEFLTERDAEHDKLSQEQALLQDRIVLLKAKLIRLRDRARIEAQSREALFGK